MSGYTIHTPNGESFTLRPSTDGTFIDVSVTLGGVDAITVTTRLDRDDMDIVDDIIVNTLKKEPNTVTFTPGWREVVCD